MEQITSRENERIKYTVKLMQKPAFRRQEGRFVLQGVKLCSDAAAAGIALETLYRTRQAADRWPRLADLPCEQVEISEQVAAKLSQQKTPQGVFAVCRLPEFAAGGIQTEKRYLALEELQDPANVGAALRSAAAFGFAGVILTRDCADPFGEKALRASMGAAFKLPILWTEDLPALLRRLSNQGMATVAAALRGAEDLRAYRYDGGGLVLVIGNEGNGLTAQTIDACGAVVKIPIRGMESLNAAAAAAVLMWELGGRQDG